MKGRWATEEHHRLGNMSLWRRQDNGVKQHSITLVVIPEEFLPPLNSEEVICIFHYHSHESTSLNSIFGTGNNTMFKNEQ